MLRLGNQVGRDPVQPGRSIGKDQDLGRAGDRIDPDLPEKPLFGTLNIDVAGPDDLVDPWNSARPQSHGRHGLCAPDSEYPIGSGQVSRRQNRRVGQASGSWWRSEDDFFDAGDFCGNDIHENGREKGGRPARDVNADALEWLDAELHPAELGIAIDPPLEHLAAMKGLDPASRARQNRPEARGGRVPGAL